MNNPKQIEAIPLDAIIDLKVSGGFYSRLHQLLMTHMNQVTPEECAKIMSELKTREPANIFEYSLVTILTMVIDIERAAKEQGKIKMYDIPPTNTTGS